MEIDSEDTSQSLLHPVTRIIASTTTESASTVTRTSFKENEDPEVMSDDSVQIIPDTPSPVFANKYQHKTMYDTPYALPKKLKLLVEEFESSSDDLHEPYPKRGSIYSRVLAQRNDTEKRGNDKKPKPADDVVMETDSDSAISTNNMKFSKPALDITNGSGDDGDLSGLSSDTEPPSQSCKTKTKKSPAKSKKDPIIDLDFSDDSDFDVFPLASARNKRTSELKESGKARDKRTKRRSLLPPIPGTLSNDSNSPNSPSVDNEYANSVITQLKKKGKFFPSLSSNPSSSSVKDAFKIDDSELDIAVEKSCDHECDTNFSMDTPANREGVTSAGSNPSPPAVASGSKSPFRGARPKIKVAYLTKIKNRLSDDGTGSDSDSLLSPPKRSRAIHAAADNTLAKKNMARVSQNLSQSPHKSASSSSPSNGTSHLSPIFDNVPSPSVVNIDWDSPMTVNSSHRTSSVEFPMNTGDDSSDMDEGEWEKFIHDLSKPYIELDMKPCPSNRQKRKAKRRSSAIPHSSAAAGSSRGSSFQIPDIVISPPKEGASAGPSFNLSPAISFTSSNQSISFTGRKSSSNTANDQQIIDDRTFTVTGASSSNKTRGCGNTVYSDITNTGTRTADSPLASMITDMAIQDIDFDVEVSPASFQSFSGFQPASSLIVIPSTSSSLSPKPFSASLQPRRKRQRKKSHKKKTSAAQGGPSLTVASPPEVIELDGNDSPEHFGTFTQGHGSHIPLQSHRRSPNQRSGRSSTERRRQQAVLSDLLPDSFDDVVVVVDATPVRQNQIDSDEAMARRLQEEMDREFAVGLANNPHTPLTPAQSSHLACVNPVFPGLPSACDPHHSMLQRVTTLPQYEFDVLCALVEGSDLPDAPPGRHCSLDEIVDPHLLAFIERNGVEVVRRERQHTSSRISDPVAALRADLSHDVVRYMDIGTMSDEEWCRGQGDYLQPVELSGIMGRGRRGRGTQRRNPRSRGLMAADEAMAVILGEDHLYSEVYMPPVTRRGRGRQGRRLMPPLHTHDEDDYEALIALGERLGEVKPKGLSKARIDLLPLRTFKKDPNVTLSSKTECNVCCSEYDDGDELRILPCFHEYHSHCVDTWIKKNPTCPVCRADVWQLYTEGSSNINTD